MNHLPSRTSQDEVIAAHGHTEGGSVYEASRKLMYRDQPGSRQD